ncbi:FtsW/RodA/SpoVE family cell cycle protein [Candidatus Obscuribacterales bacterium]|nr:FtsW/RodA/SpoVE family cell cycle protein [Candidatus Obscuribacterales bacterium]
MVLGHEAQGAQRWLQLGQITLQPSEISKIVVILFTMAASSSAFQSAAFRHLQSTRVILPPAFLSSNSRT